MGDRRALMAWVRVPSDNSLPQARRDVDAFFQQLGGSAQRQGSSILKHYFISSTEEKISKFSDQKYEKLAYKLDVRGPVEKVREELIRQWQMDFELKVEHPSRSTGAVLDIQGVSLRVGNLVAPNTFATQGGSEAHSLRLMLEHASRQVSIFFNSQSNVHPLSKLSFQYRNVRRLIISVETSRIILCFHLLNGPSLWTCRYTGIDLEMAEPETEPRDAFYNRSSSISSSGFHLDLENSEAFKTLMVTLPEHQKLSSLYKVMQMIGRHGDAYFIQLKVVSDVDDTTSHLLGGLSSLIDPEHFGALYAVLGCISYSAEFRQRLRHKCQTRAMVDLVRSNLADEKSRRVLKDVFEDILFSLENGDIVDILDTAKYLIRKYTERPKEIKIIPGTALVRRVIVTPGRTLYRPAELHASNRILRNYEADYAITVSFRDHDFQKLTFSGVDLVPEVVSPILLNDLKILDRAYQMLASSSSQLRDHVVWMYARDSNKRTADNIRDEMGNFNGISNVAKKMARMGQTLSSTQETVDIEDHEYEVVDDVSWRDARHPESGEPYCFSDGVGSISSELMQDVATCLGWQADPPSAIQIRFKGCKGMLSLDPRLSGRKMRLRKSMQKFTCSAQSGESPKWSLEVIRRTWPTPLYLNRQLIPLLEHHGIASEIFHQLQLNMVFTCAQSLIDQDEALKKLSAYVKRRFPFRNMSRSGWDLLADPFCNNMLYHLFFESLKNVKEKARIAVPLEHGRNMLGVMDETGILEYGQVFVQYTSMGPEDEGTAFVVQGKVLMSKCPCVHPGDVRVLTAVDVPELRTLKDCVVFPSRGKRPHPQEMAGSDLDGDEYIVIWDQRFIFRGQNEEPFVYADVPPRVPRDFTKHDEATFFVKYIQNDIIGIASSAHLALSDKLGFNHTKCLNLVGKISAALDFAKTEEPARITPEEKAMEYPDFMTNGRTHSYVSKKVLGELYRTIKQLIPEERVANTKSRICPIEVPGWRKFHEQALQARNDYESNLSAILQQHGISTEAEVFTGVISRHSRFNSMKHDRENAEIVIGKQCEFLLETTRRRFDNEVERLIARVDPDDEEEASMIKRQLASAWCMSVYGEADDEERNYFSFPWSIAATMADTLKWLKTQPDHKRDPVVKNVLRGVLEENFSSSGHTLNTFMREWLETDADGASLNQCQCFAKVVDQYELEVGACDLSVAEKILLLVRKLIYGEFEAPNPSCPKICQRLLQPAQHSVPKISVILSRLYLRMCVNKGETLQGIAEEQQPFIETVSTIRIETDELRGMLKEDRKRGFETTIGRLKSWTNIDDVRIRLKAGRRRNGHGEVDFEFFGSSKQVEDLKDVLYDSSFERAFLSDDKSLLSKSGTLERTPGEGKALQELTQLTLRIVTRDFRRMLEEDRRRGFRTTIRRLKSWTSIAYVKIRLKAVRRSTRMPSVWPGEVVFEFSGTSKQVEDLRVVLHDSYFQRALLSDDKSLLFVASG